MSNKSRTMRLLDGTEVREGDKVRAQGEDGSWQTCEVLEIFRIAGGQGAMLTRRSPIFKPLPKHWFGTVIRARYQIRSLLRPSASL